ncbi:MAG: hypothetical protein ACMZI2_06230 [Candidatus Symbiodolus clandestinus]
MHRSQRSTRSWRPAGQTAGRQPEQRNCPRGPTGASGRRGCRSPRTECPPSRPGSQWQCGSQQPV